MTNSSNHEQLAAVRAGYDRWAAVYDHDANPLLVLEEPEVRRIAGEVRGLEVLDLGCGTGRHTAWLSRAGARVTALDFSPGMLARAHERLAAEDVSWLVHDLHEPLPLADQSFDLVVSGLVLEHLSDLASFFTELRRVLRPRARAVVSAMHPAMFLQGSQARFTCPESGEIVQPGSVPHGMGELVMAALGAGLELRALGEHAPDAALATRFPRAEKYVGWPMLVVLELAR